MVLAWVVTLPAAGLAAAGIYGVTRLPLPAAATALTALGALGLVLLYRAWGGTARPGDIIREVEQRERVAPVPA